MLLQFTVENFASFRDETTLNLLANIQKEHSDSLIEKNGARGLASIAIFGPNAGGKSNLFKALASSINFIRFSNARQINDVSPYIIPFLMDNIHPKMPSSFYFVFLKNGLKYEYGFKADQKTVHEEFLYVYKTQKRTLIFERKNINEYIFPTATKKELEPFVKMTDSNKLFLSSATAWNAKETRDAYLFFANDIDVYDSQFLEQNLYAALDTNKDPSLPAFMSKLLKAADINISGYSFETRNSFVPGMKQMRILTKHQISVDGGAEEYQFDLQNESNGTKRLFAYGPIIKRALENGKTVFVDEMDNCLHPSLCRYLISLFQNHETNPHGAQLIFNTQDISLLDLSLFRRDQIYFVDKKNDTGVSDLYSLDDFSVRKNDLIQKGYLLGRFGALPNIYLDA